MTTTRICQHEPCGGEMPLTARAHARYCSGRCRTAACRARRSLPTDLTRRARWVRRSVRKSPLSVGGGPASVTDPATWTRYAAANRSSIGAGLGFVLDGDGVVCVDLDHCLTPDGALLPWAQPIVDAAGPTWIERSVGGDGLHIWGLGELPLGRRIRLDGGGVAELYGTGRYIAVTGETFGGTPRRLGPLDELIDELL